MKTHIIQLESHDDATSVRDKIAWSKSPRILLVWPRRGSARLWALELTLVQRYAQRMGAQLGIVSHDAAVSEIAAEVGIPVFGSTLAAQQRSWRRPRRLNWRGVKERTPAAELRLSQAILHKTPTQRAWLRWLAFGLGILAVVAIGLLFAPSARIELSPWQETREITLELWASPDIISANPSGRIPAYVLTVVAEGSAQRASSGSVELPDGQAEGEVVFSNLGIDRVDLPAGVVVLSAPQAGQVVRFATTRAVSIPGGVGETASAEVRAVLPGSAGNIPAGAIQAVEGSLGLYVLAANPEPFEGGSERISLAPAEEDYDGLEAELRAGLEETVMEDMNRQLTEGERIIPGSLQVSHVIRSTREPEVGQPGDFARLTQQVEFTAYRVREVDLTAVAQPALAASLPNDTQLIPDSLRFDFLDAADLSGEGVAHWRMTAGQIIEAVWSPAEAARLVAGRSPQEATQALAGMFSLTQTPRVTVFPAWWPRLPFLPMRIEVAQP